MNSDGILVPPCEADALRAEILASLEKQGFVVDGLHYSVPPSGTKDELRLRHQLAVRHRVDASAPRLKRKEDQLLSWIADGRDLKPELIVPSLVEVHPDSEEELLFRYASLHWSIPVSSGYGRRLRFLVLDQQNKKLIGIIGLCDPVFSLSDRDAWIGWNSEQKRERLSHVLEAFVLGAVPPYNFLLGGKLIALLAASTEVRKAFKDKYGNRASFIEQKRHSGEVALVTTVSALGRSSIYNRLRSKTRQVFIRVGSTRGYGDLYFTNGLYSKIAKFASEWCIPTAKKESWGSGFRNRREVIGKTLAALGLRNELAFHGIGREIYVAPLAENTCSFLRGESETLRFYSETADQVMAYFKERWLLKRAQNSEVYRNWKAAEWRLWE